MSVFDFQKSAKKALILLTVKKIAKIILIVLSILSVVTFIILLPFILNWLGKVDTSADFFITDLKVADFLVYYASALSFIGTIILGYLTLRQNKRAQQKTDEVNKLQLELQKRSMILAESQYKKDDISICPKFEISLRTSFGAYLNPTIRIKNVSSTIISNLTFISFCVKDEEGNILRNISKVRLNNTSLVSGAEAFLETEMQSLVKNISNNEYKYFDNVDFILEFSCEDEKYQVHYYRATRHIKLTKDFEKELWEVEKVG